MFYATHRVSDSLICMFLEKGKYMDMEYMNIFHSLWFNYLLSMWGVFFLAK